MHGDKYDYSKVEYKNQLTEVCIICPIHGEFWIKPKYHISKRKYGCHYCASYKTITTESFIERAKKVHGDKYDYSKTKYVKMEEKICIICPIHGEFWQTPHNHLKFGCNKCRTMHSKMEDEIELLLLDNNINFIPQKTFDWLKYKDNLFLDFYLPEYNIAIECQGEQHYNKFRWENDSSKLEIRQNRDKVKRFLCEELYNIKIIYYAKIKYDENIITDKNNLLKEIYNNVKKNN